MVKTNKRSSASIILGVLLGIALLLTMSAPALAGEAQTVTVEYTVSDTVIPETAFDLYKIGELNGTTLVLDSPYDESGVDVDLWKEGSDAEEWADAASTLYDYVKAKGIGEDSAQHPITDASGTMTFTGENGCVYLLGTENETKVGDTIYKAQPMLIWVVDGKVNGVKIKPTKKTEAKGKYKIVKHWKGDNQSTRPESIEVEIYEDNKFIETVELNKENNWCYEWTDNDNKGSWTCVETVPNGYKSTVKKAKDGDTLEFLLTNTARPTGGDKPHRKPSNDDKTSKNPQAKTPRTGDPTSFRWITLAMALSGFALVVIAVRRRREE